MTTAKRNRSIPKHWCVVIALVLFTILLGSVYLLRNHYVTHYSGFNYLPWRLVWISPFLIVVFYMGSIFKNESPKWSLFTVTYSLYFLMLIGFAMLTNGIQFTPYSRIDTKLFELDQSVAFSTATLMAWTASHPLFKSLLEWAYQFLNLQMIFVPLLLPWLFGEKRTYELFIYLLIAFLIGTTVYYFFPTVGPVSTVNSPYFLPGQKATYLKFFQIHHGVKSVSGDGGLIAFPSFHVTWALLLTYAMRCRRWWFYLLLIINMLVIIATLFLGWHYLMDVIGALVLVIITLSIGNQLVKKTDENLY